MSVKNRIAFSYFLGAVSLGNAVLTACVQKDWYEAGAWLFLSAAHWEIIQLLKDAK